MKAIRLILGDQLSHGVSALRDLDPSEDIVLMAEVREEAEYVPHHKQKLVLIFSAMRHFARELKDKDVRVDYIELEARENRGSLEGELARAIKRHKAARVIVTEPGEWRLWQAMQGWSRKLGVPVEVREDNRFLCSRIEFAGWAAGRKQPRMEHFYRSMRRKTGWLMNKDGGPRGGGWNFDAQNRKSLPKDARLPHRRRFRPDAITQEVMAMVHRRFADHFGELDDFGWAVTRKQALQALRHFLEDCLPRFGDYQDAMQTEENFLYHSLVSPYLNAGLLQPREVCEKALQAYAAGGVSLASIEGFIRQILGWREYVRGIYWLHMPDYAHSNHLKAKRALPAFYWSGETSMRCLRECIASTRRHAYAHHIQRLMVTGNFALLIGAAPAEVEQWYLAVYADAYEWVELPNTHGMTLFADGGLLGSKPYAASAAYINRMSDYCKGCEYDPKTKLGEGACPFNYLYWNFLIENQGTLGDNPRMAMPYRNLAHMDKSRKAQIRREARAFLNALD